MKTELEAKVSILLSTTEAIMQFKKEIAIEIYRANPGRSPEHVGAVAQRMAEEVFKMEIEEIEGMGK